MLGCSVGYQKTSNRVNVYWASSGHAMAAGDYVGESKSVCGTPAQPTAGTAFELSAFTAPEARSGSSGQIRASFLVNGEWTLPVRDPTYHVWSL